jgi:hypothetical protein
MAAILQAVGTLLGQGLPPSDHIAAVRTLVREGFLVPVGTATGHDPV